MALSPEQRALVAGMRRALAPLPERERRELLEAMREAWHRVSAPMLAQHEQNIAKICAVELAMEERLGREPEDGDVILPSDELRGGKIFDECW